MNRMRSTCKTGLNQFSRRGRFGWIRSTMVALQMMAIVRHSNPKGTVFLKPEPLAKVYAVI